MGISLSALKPEYQKLWDGCVISPSIQGELQQLVARIQANKCRYQSIATTIGCPWEFIAAIHNMEASLNFNCHLHNGDSLSAQTINEPPRRPQGNPPFTWEESAIDALRLMEIDQVKDWSIPGGMLFQAEQYNGWGYRLYHPECLSPYLWSGSNHYTSGKYVSDGSFDSRAKSEQVGVVPILMSLSMKRLLSGGRTKIKTRQDCWFTLSPTNWSELPKDQRGKVAEGTVLEVSAWREVDEDYLVVTFSGITLKGRNTWHLHKDDILMRQEAKKELKIIPVASNDVALKVPYLTQLDNKLYPMGSCNVTSIAMCMGFFGHPLVTDGIQLEDELSEYCDRNNLDRHSPQDLKVLVERFGYKDNFQANAKWADVKRWLQLGNPCVTHGWFTASGHIVCLIGYNAQGLLVHDPYGEWYSNGYDTSKSGAGLTYSYAMMRETCGSDGDLWIHFLSR